MPEKFRQQGLCSIPAGDEREKKPTRSSYQVTGLIVGSVKN